MQKEAEPHFRISLERYLSSDKAIDEFSGYKGGKDYPQRGGGVE